MPRLLYGELNLMNEIQWETWSTRAFDRAKRENKPVLLSISAVWCHWCHVMDRTTYANPEVAEQIQRRFVPVRVDNDLRPDINARYNMGGWPTTAFLTPDGMTIAGATYLPPEQMLKALDNIADVYAQNKDEIAARALELREQRRDYEPVAHGELRTSMIARVTEELSDAYDAQYGGFGEAPKFPQPEALEMLLLEYRVTGETRLLDMVLNTMQHMASGGMYDHEEGGFFRYSTTRDWSIPHFEKMAEDHAGLLRVLAQLARLCSDGWIRDTLRTAGGYVRTVWRDAASGLFAGSQDADEEYYAAPLVERKKMKAPFVDHRSYSNWTAGLASAFYTVADALGDETFAHEATVTLDAMHERLCDATGLLFHVAAPGKAPSIRGLLGDQVAYVRALLDAHEYTGEARFIERAVAHADATMAHFAAQDGGFYDSAHLEEEIGNLSIPDRPIGDNGIFAEQLLRLAELGGEERFRTAGEQTILLYAKTYARAGSFGAAYVRALRRMLSPQISVRLVGGVAETSDLRAAARRLSAPFVNIRTLEPAQAPAYELPASPAPAAYVCRGTACGPPLTVPAELESALETLASGAR
jgi:uncharacterized protein YyaL (SSP411 family)